MKKKLLELFSFIFSVFLFVFCIQNNFKSYYFEMPKVGAPVENQTDVVSTQSSNGKFPIGMKEYFSGLKYNFPANQMGTCGYVALSQILTYYDTTLNDYIVPERYDAESSDINKLFLSYNSPGCLYQELDASSIESYISEIERTSTTNLQSKLLTCYKSAYGDYAKDDDGNYTFSNGPWDYQQILNQYFDSFFKSRFTVENYERNANESIEDCTYRLKGIIRNAIDEGYPAVISITRDFKNNHAVVAYDYDENGEIYANFGWRSNEFQSTTFHSTLSEQNYNEIFHASIIKMDNVPYVASNNYSLNGTKLDSKGNEFVAHTHNLTSWSILNSNMHSSYCTLCGTEFKEMHNYVGSICGDCGYRKRGGGIIMITREDD